MSDSIKVVLNILKKELLNSDFQKEILQPMIQWIFIRILPYVVCITISNFFLTIFAVSFVLYINK